MRNWTPFEKAKAVEHLHGVKEFRLDDQRSAYFKSTGAIVNPGDFPQFSIDVITGERIENPDARAPDEVTIGINETCQIGWVNNTDFYRLLLIYRGQAVLHHFGSRQTGEQIDELVRVSPYSTN